MFSFYRLVEKLNKKSEQEELNEQIGLQLIFQGIMLFFTLVFITLLFFLASKPNDKLTRIAQKVTGENKWKVRILDSKVPNAMALAVGTHIIFINKGLVKMLTERELIAVMLHEVKHMKTLDSLQKITIIGGLPAFLGILAARFAMNPTTMGLSVACSLISVLCIMFLPTFVKVTLGRWHETTADSYAVKFGYGKELASTLDKMDKWVKKEEAKHECGVICRLNKKIERTFDEHPETQVRIERILQKDEVQRALISKDVPALRKAIMSFKTNE